MTYAAPRIGLLRKLLAGDALRKTRLHDEKGNPVDCREWKYLPLVLQRFVARKLFGKLYAEPWWTFCVKRRVAEILTPDMTAVEFGSGQSTLWLAPKLRHLTAIEGDPEWHERVKANLAHHGISNVTLRLRTDESYSNVDDIADSSVDFCVVDGRDRGLCVHAILPKMKRGGWIYLDNSDKDMTQGDDGVNIRAAEAELRRHVPETGIEMFTGFTIGSINTHQGMLCHLPD